MGPSSIYILSSLAVLAPRSFVLIGMYGIAGTPVAGMPGVHYPPPPPPRGPPPPPPRGGTSGLQPPPPPPRRAPPGVVAPVGVYGPSQGSSGEEGMRGKGRGGSGSRGGGVVDPLDPEGNSVFFAYLF